MGSNNFTNTELVLKLGLASSSSMAETTINTTKKPNPSSDHRFEPSLTLAISSNSGGGGSSFSNASVKREREVASEESERRMVNYIGEDGEEDEDGGVNGRKKLRLTKDQSQLLELAFKLHTGLNPKQKQELARELKLRPRQVEVWFQNRRARTKLRQTEVDHEYLKKCHETLTHENRRLRQELQELKTQKLSQPIYMKLPTEPFYYGY